MSGLISPPSPPPPKVPICGEIAHFFPWVYESLWGINIRYPHLYKSNRRVKYRIGTYIIEQTADSLLPVEFPPLGIAKLIQKTQWALSPRLRSVIARSAAGNRVPAPVNPTEILLYRPYSCDFRFYIVAIQYNEMSYTYTCIDVGAHYNNIIIIIT